MDVTFVDLDRTNRETVLDLMCQYYAYDRIPYDRQAACHAVEQLAEDRSRGRIWVIRAGGETAGYCVLTLGYSLEFRGRTAFIDELFVQEGFRGRGIGTRALRFLKETAGALGVKVLRLEVERKNSDARELYRKAGFEEQDRDLMTVLLGEEKHLA